jgi:hypothetical protein
VKAGLLPVGRRPRRRFKIELLVLTQKRSSPHEGANPMSLYEFVTVMVSMILALCLGHVLRSASFLAKTERDVRFYLPHSLWLVEILLAVVNHWWSLWDLRDVEWSYASFVYILAAPILVTLATGLLSPTQGGSDPVDLQSHYERIRRLFAAVLVAYTLFMWFDGPLFAGQAVFGPVGSLHVPIAAASLVPALTKSYRANVLAPGTIIAALLLVMVLRWSSTI